MKALPIILVAAGAGVAYVIWKRNRDAANTPIVSADDSDKDAQTVKDEACDLARKGAELAAEKEYPGTGPAAGEAAYLACKLLEAPLHNSIDDNAKEAAKRDAKNQQLNGAIDLPMTNLVGYAYQGAALRYKNGCVPFAGAPGFDKCAAGTESMWKSDTDLDHDHDAGFRDYTYPAFRNKADELAWWKAQRDKLDDRGDWNGLRATRLAGAMFSGSTEPQNPDPVTRGTVLADGTWAGTVRGVKMTCPAGQAPAMWDAAGNPLHDARTGLPPCAPLGVSSFVPSSTGATPLTGAGTQTQLACGPNQTAPAGMTWDATTSNWRRLVAGETPNAGPCDPAKYAADQKLAAILNDTSGIAAVTGSGTAYRQ